MITDAATHDWLNAASRRALLIGCVAAIASGAAYLFARNAFYPTYLVAVLFWLGISLGCLAISMLHHVTGGGWGFPARRVVEAGASTTVLMAVLFLPVLVGMPQLYVWSNSDVVAADEILQRKTHYLNVNAFLVRAAVYFAIWIFWAWLLNSLTRTSDADRQYRRQRRLAVLSAWGLTLWGLCVTFASVDWAMSIEPHWFSSMFGVLFMAGQAVSALSFTIIVLVLLNHHGRAINRLTTPLLHDLGNLLLAFVMFWSYVSFMQYLIIWGGNLPEETPWYIRRSHGGWQSIVFFLMVLHFLLPVLLLLMRQTKRREERLVRLAVLLLVMRLVDLAWLVLPTFAANLTGGSSSDSFEHGGGTHGTVASLHWYELWPLIVILPAIGGLWLAFFFWRLAARVNIPVYEFVPLQDSQDVVPGHATS